MRAMQLVSQMLAQTSPSTHSSSFSALTPCPPSVTCTEPALRDAGATQLLTYRARGDAGHKNIISWTALYIRACKHTAGHLILSAGLVPLSYRGRFA